MISLLRSFQLRNFFFWQIIFWPSPMGRGLKILWQMVKFIGKCVSSSCNVLNTPFHEIFLDIFLRTAKCFFVKINVVFLTSKISDERNNYYKKGFPHFQKVELISLLIRVFWRCFLIWSRKGCNSWKRRLIRSNKIKYRSQY